MGTMDGWPHNIPDEINKMGVRDFCPGRRFNKGPRPGLADTTIKGGDKKWKKSHLPQTPAEKRLLIARLVQVMVTIVFQHHLFL